MHVPDARSAPSHASPGFAMPLPHPQSLSQPVAVSDASHTPSPQGTSRPPGPQAASRTSKSALATVARRFAVSLHKCSIDMKTSDY
jgi:hypothetical protein